MTSLVITKIKPKTPLTESILWGMLNKIDYWTRQLSRKDSPVENYHSVLIDWQNQNDETIKLNIKVQPDITVTIWYDNNVGIHSNLSESADDKLEFFIKLESIINQEIDKIKQQCNEFIEINLPTRKNILDDET